MDNKVSSQKKKRAEKQFPSKNLFASYLRYRYFLFGKKKQTNVGILFGLNKKSLNKQNFDCVLETKAIFLELKDLQIH